MQLNINLDKLAALNIDNACMREDLSGNRMATTSNVINPNDLNNGQQNSGKMERSNISNFALFSDPKYVTSNNGYELGAQKPKKKCKDKKYFVEGDPAMKVGTISRSANNFSEMIHKDSVQKYSATNDPFCKTNKSNGSNGPNHKKDFIYASQNMEFPRQAKKNSFVPQHPLYPGVEKSTDTSLNNYIYNNSFSYYQLNSQQQSVRIHG